MSSKISTVGIAIALCIIWSTAHSQDDYPTDKDLQVAYCDGAAQAGLQLQTVRSSPTLGDVLDRRLKHFTAYLVSRGYFDRKDILSLAPAINQGKVDMRAVDSAASRCVAECKTGELPKSKTPENVQACAKACMVRVTNGRSQKLEMCEAVENSLPF